MENPKCIVCGEEIYISHPIQRNQKKYCGYKCQAKKARESKKDKSCTGSSSQIFDKINKTKRKEQVLIWEK